MTGNNFSSLLIRYSGQQCARTSPRKLYRSRRMATSASLKSSSNINQPEVKSWHPPRPRRFAPLDKSHNKNNQQTNTPQLKGIIFDVDGTLCLPQNYMFREMRAALKIDKSVDILDHIRSLSSEPDSEPGNDNSSNKKTADHERSSPQSRAQEAIRTIERNAMSSQQPQPGLLELMTYLERRSIPKALCTRNFPAPVQHLIDTFLADLEKGFDMIVTRETVGLAPKPSPEGLWAIAKCWGLDQQSVTAEDGASVDGNNAAEDVLGKARKQLGSQIIMVGDSIDDMAAGYRAGAATVLLLNEDNEYLADHEFVDLGIQRLDELVHVLDAGFVGRNT